MIQRLYDCGYALFMRMLVLLLTAVAGTDGCSAQVTAWTRVGPGGGGATFRPTFSYRHPDEFLLRCDMTGTYHSSDGGRSYRQTNFPNGPHSFAFDPANDQILYVGSSALYRSSDRGRHWKMLYPKPEQVTGQSWSGDHAEMSMEVAKGVSYWTHGQTINNIRIDPSDTRRICFTVGRSIFYSRDGGGSWTKNELSSRVLYLYRTTHIFSADSIYVPDRNSGGIKASALPAAVRPATAFAGGRTKEGVTILYALHHNNDHSQISVSHDMGRNWTSSDFPSTADAVKLACSEFDASKAYVLVNRLEESQGHMWYGVWKTSDGGLHWNWVWKAGGGMGQYGVPDGQNPSNLQDGWAGNAFGKEGVEMMDIGVAPYNGDLAIATDWYRAMKTTDGGNTWRGIYSHTNPDGSVSSTGLDVTTTYGVHFDPYDHQHIAISCTDIGYHHSFDGGKSWIRSVKGVPTDWVNTCYWMVFDPAQKGKIWSAWSGMHDLPRGKMTRDPHWKEDCRGGICVSTDGGRHWTPMVNGMDQNSPATCIVMDTTSQPGARTLYATVYNKGVFKSADNGKTWILKNKGLDENTCAFRITQAGNGDLYLVVCPTPRFGSMPLHFHSGAVYKSVDGAETWTKLSLTEGETLFPSGVTVDPSNPQRVYVACWAGDDKHISLPGGIFLSEDGGQHWTSVFDKRNYVYDVTVDPHHPGRVYCNTFTGAAWRSDDYGRNWQRLDGYDFQWGHRVIVDENDPEKVYLTTYGSGVWHGHSKNN